MMTISQEEEIRLRYQYVFTPSFLELLRNDGLLTQKMNRADAGAKLMSMLDTALRNYNKSEKIYRNELRFALTTLLVESMKEYSTLYQVSNDEKHKDKVK